MMQQRSYRVAFGLAVIFHICIMGALLSKSSNPQPVLQLSESNQLSAPQDKPLIPKEKTIKAVSVDNQAVTETVNRIKKERQEKQKAEQMRQLALEKKATQARNQRIKEQKRLARLKDEATKLAKKQKKLLAEEKRRLQQLASQKKAEEKRLADLKNKQIQMAKLQALEEKKRAALKKKQAEQAKIDALNKRQLEAEKVAREAEKNARIAGEVDKYKAMIINAISRKWILPDNIDDNVFSQFRIQLAPSGAVLEVRLTQSSGDPILDRSAQSAIYKASPLPVPSDPDAFDVFRDISLTVRPENARG